MKMRMRKRKMKNVFIYPLNHFTIILLSENKFCFVVKGENVFPSFFPSFFLFNVVVIVVVVW